MATCLLKSAHSCFDIEVSSPQRNPDGMKDPVCMLAVYGNDGFAKVLTGRSQSKEVEFVPDENTYSRFKEFIQK